MILLGRRTAAWIYAVAGIATPLSIIVAVKLDVLPSLSLVAFLPSLLLIKPLRWAFSAPDSPVPVPALGANVVWNLTTNTVMALALVADIFFAWPPLLQG